MASARQPHSQGYCLTEQQRRELRFAIRFPSAVCLPLVALALVLGSPLMLAALETAGLALGGVLLAACTSATVLNFCVPSEVLTRLERVRRHHAVSA